MAAGFFIAVSYRVCVSGLDMVWIFSRLSKWVKFPKSFGQGTIFMLGCKYRHRWAMRVIAIVEVDLNLMEAEELQAV